MRLAPQFGKIEYAFSDNSRFNHQPPQAVQDLAKDLIAPIRDEFKGKRLKIVFRWEQGRDNPDRFKPEGFLNYFWIHANRKGIHVSNESGHYIIKPTADGKAQMDSGGGFSEARAGLLKDARAMVEGIGLQEWTDIGHHPRGGWSFNRII